ncbi:MAG: ABC transporter ATP-binding protein [Heliobacteriaceae bacterium]|nr:ABC transporter ATP-binding protein [Heliobacteriaceae bacterium]
MNIVLEARNLKKVYGSRGNAYPALDGIDLQIKEGEFVGIMGPSGAGKTTLLNLIASIDNPTGGTIIIDGDYLVTMNEDQLADFRRQKLGFLFQDFNLLDTLTVKENVVLPLALARVPAAEIEARVSRMAVLLGLQEILSKYPYEISGGQKQRTAAARAIIHHPRLVLADEPTGALDSRSSTELLQCLADLNQKNATTIMMVTHDAFAASYCRRILFIKDGILFSELVRGGTRKDFFHKILDVLAVLGGDNRDFI